MKMKIIRQHDIKDCGAACLSMICTHYGLYLPMAKFRELIGVDAAGANIYGIVKGAEKVGLCGTALEGTPNEFVDSAKQKEFAFPLIARVIIDNSLEHFVVVQKISGGFIYVADPAKGKKKYSYREFFKIWTGHIVTFEKTEKFEKKNENKGTLFKFAHLITKQKGLLFLVFVMSIVISAIGVAGAFIFQVLIEGIEHAEHGHLDGFMGHSLSWVCLAVIVLYLFQGVVSFLRGISLAQISKRIDIPLMLGYYNHVADLPLKHLDSRNTGEIMSRFSDASSIRDAISGTTLSLMLDTIMVAACVAVLFSLNSLLFLITLVTVLLYALVIIFFVKPIKNVNEEIMEQNAVVTSYLKETVDGMETVKAFEAQEKVKDKTREKFIKLENLSVRGSIIYTLQDSLCSIVTSIGVVVLLWCGTLLVMEGFVSLGTLMTFYSLLGYFIDPISRLIDLQPSLQTAVVAAERLRDILELETEKEAEKSDIGGGVELQNVTFRYGYRQNVLKNVSMKINAGERVALVGESGSGKTTLAKLIMAFYEPCEGRVLVGGQDLSGVLPRSIRGQIAYISQEVFLFSDTIKNNLTMGDESISEEQIKKACRQSRADEFIEKLPLGYNTLLGENGHNLSGGQRQRLAIARALLKNPKIIIMDEATSNLDTVTEDSIRKTVEELCGITCIIIAHRLSTVKKCDRIYVMNDGEICECGTHDELMQKGGLYKSFYDNMV